MNKGSIRFGSVAAIIALFFVASGSAFAGQPHMKNALANLQAAKAQLEQADADKGGHRAGALKAVEEAIIQVKKGIAFDKAH